MVYYPMHHMVFYDVNGSAGLHHPAVCRKADLVLNELRKRGFAEFRSNYDGAIPIEMSKETHHCHKLTSCQRFPYVSLCLGRPL